MHRRDSTSVSAHILKKGKGNLVQGSMQLRLLGFPGNWHMKV